jgi:hypothetical protein
MGVHRVNYVLPFCLIMIMGLVPLSDIWASEYASLKDLMLEKGQITIDEWVELQAEEEKRAAKALEESQAVGDTPVRAKWYEKLNIRGYAQIRWNRLGQPNGRLINDQGDKSIGDNNGFLLRRARLVLSGQPHDRIFTYIQPDFASTVSGSGNVLQLRDWYADLFLTQNKEWRIRAGQSKVPYGFENMQSSQNRLALDRNDALNSAVLNERDLGFFLYYAPTEIRARFRYLVESGLKGSGDYGMFGIGVYNGQTANRPDMNDDKHFIVKFAYPHEFENGQILEVGASAYRGKFNVSRAPIVPLSGGAAQSPGGFDNILDQRFGAYFVWYPQPFGLQAEYTFGRGPQLNATRTRVDESSLYGGYVQAMYNYRCETYCLMMLPFIRWQEYYGGKKHEPNAPENRVRELELGIEYQFSRAVELVTSYSFTERTSADRTGPNPYQSHYGNLLRFQLQWNY